MAIERPIATWDGTEAQKESWPFLWRFMKLFGMGWVSGSSKFFQQIM
jgi:hypothetical protein